MFGQGAEIILSADPSRIIAGMALAQKSVEQAFNNMSSNTHGAIKKISTDFETISKEANKSTEAFKTVGQGAAVAGGALALGLGAAVKTAMDFDAQMSKVKALSGATDVQFQQLRSTALKLGADTSFSASKAAEGMQNLAAAGFNVQDTISAMPGMLDAAAASGEDFAIVSDIMVSSMSGFQLKATDMGHIADVLASAANASSISISDIGVSLKYVAPVATAAGASIEQTSAALAILGNAGIKADSAGTALRMSFIRLAAPPKKAAEAMDELKIRTTDAHGKMLPFSNVIGQLHTKFQGLSQSQQIQAASSIFGAEAMSAMLVLINKGPEELNKLTQSFENSQGAAKKMADVMKDNLKGSVEQLTGSLESAAISLGSALAPAIRVVAVAITEVINRFNSLPAPVQSAIAIGAALTAGLLLIAGAAGIIIGFIPAMITGLGALSGVFLALTSPVALIIAAFVAVGAGLVSLYNKNEWFRKEVQAAWQAISKAGEEIWGELSKNLRVIWDAMATVGKALFNEYKAFMKAHGTEITAILQSAWNVIKNVIGLALDVIKGLIKVGLALMRGDWQAAWNAMKQMGTDAMVHLKSIIKSGVEGIRAYTKLMYDIGIDLIKGLWNGIKSLNGWVGDQVKGFIRDNVVNPVKSLLEISSPSKLMAQFGRYTAEGFAIGMAENHKLIVEQGEKLAAAVKEKTRAAKNMAIIEAKEMSSRIKTEWQVMAEAIKNGFDRISQSISLAADLSKAKFELWMATMSKTATESQKLEHQVALLKDQISQQQQVVAVANEAYWKFKQAHQESTDAGKQAELQWINERTTLANLNTQLADTTNGVGGLTSALNTARTAADYLWDAAQRAWDAGNTVQATTYMNTAISGGDGLSEVGTDAYRLANPDMPDWLGGGRNTTGLHTGGDVTRGGMFRVGEYGEERVWLPAGAAVRPGNGSKEESGDTYYYNFAEGAIQISARDLKEFKDATDFFKRFPQVARAGGVKY